MSAIACLCVVQGLLLAGLQLGRPAHRTDLGVGATIGAELCRADMGGGKAPSQHDHSQCCILCSSSAEDGLVRFAAVLFDAILFPTLPAADAADGRFADEPVARPAGWTSSWSSRAPPFFS